MKEHFVITFLLMVFILFVHYSKEKRRSLKIIYIYIYIKLLTKEKCNFLVYFLKNDRNGDIPETFSEERKCQILEEKTIRGFIKAFIKPFEPPQRSVKIKI